MHLINPMDTLPKTGRVYVEYSGNKYNGYARGITPIAISNEYAIYGQTQEPLINAVRLLLGDMM